MVLLTSCFTAPHKISKHLKFSSRYLEIMLHLWCPSGRPRTLSSRSEPPTRSYQIWHPFLLVKARQNTRSPHAHITSSKTTLHSIAAPLSHRHHARNESRRCNLQDVPEPRPCPGPSLPTPIVHFRKRKEKINEQIGAFRRKVMKRLERERVLGLVRDMWRDVYGRWRGSV